MHTRSGADSVVHCCTVADGMDAQTVQHCSGGVSDIAALLCSSLRATLPPKGYKFSPTVSQVHTPPQSSEFIPPKRFPTKAETNKWPSLQRA